MNPNHSARGVRNRIFESGPENSNKQPRRHSEGKESDQNSNIPAKIITSKKTLIKVRLKHSDSQKSKASSQNSKALSRKTSSEDPKSSMRDSENKLTELTSAKQWRRRKQMKLKMEEQ
jgi:hypothetical protein